MSTTLSTEPVRRWYYPDMTAYWGELSEPLPDWAFEFISIHSNGPGYGYILRSPMCLVRLETSRRPAFERKTFATFADAKRYAVRLMSRIDVRLHIVNCIRWTFR
jgi:hypothetical protein